jgi:glycosyltransferase involved in cell wall biosynthesis
LARSLTGSAEVILVASGVAADIFYGIPAITEECFSDELKKTAGTIIQISRGDYVTPGRINLIAQHGPHHILNLIKTDLKHVDAVICVSKFSRNQQREYGIGGEKLHVVPNGIDTSILKFKSQGRKPSSFIYAGHIRGYKGIAIMLRAFMDVYQNHPEASLHLYGENMAWTDADEGMDWLKEKNYLDRAGRIDWTRVSADCPGIHYRGEITQDELGAFFNCTANTICPSVIPETFGLVSLEAQACGCVPIYANHGGYPETIMRSTPRLSFIPCNYESLAKTMLKAIKENPDDARRSKIAREAANCTWDRTNAAIVSIIARARTRKKLFTDLRSIFKR